MNRSFQSIAALLISLSGAMLAVMWTPAEGPRPTAPGSSVRRRAATIPCGFVATGPLIAMRKAPANAAVAAGLGPVASGAADAEASSLPLRDSAPLFWDAQWLASRGTSLARWGRAIADTPAAKTVTAAFGEAFRPLLPPGVSEPALADQSLRDEERRRIEAEYAAAELAAARGGEPWLAGLARDAIVAATKTNWSALSEQISDEFNYKYEELIIEFGWQEMVRPLVEHVRRQHQRLVLREALLREMDRRFLDAPVTKPDGQPAEKPQFRRPTRRLYLAAAEALKSLSRALDAAAEQLEAESRQDVAELHNPLENNEEKR